MPRFAVSFSALLMLCAGGAFGQGSFGQIAYGGCYSTTFTLVNMNPQSAANVSMTFYADDGSALVAPVTGSGNTSTYAFTIQPNSAQDVVLSTTNTNTVEGWASVTVSNGVEVQGQAVYLCQIAGRPNFEAVVPLSGTGSASCIIPFPPSANPVIIMPFDNTAGLHTTSLAFANTTGVAETIPIEFDDQSGNKLASDTLSLGPFAHTAFASTTKYTALTGTKGVLRISASTSTVAVVGFLFNFTGPFTTIIPITQ